MVPTDSVVTRKARTSSPAARTAASVKVAAKKSPESKFAGKQELNSKPKDQEKVAATAGARGKAACGKPSSRWGTRLVAVALIIGLVVAVLTLSSAQLSSVKTLFDTCVQSVSKMQIASVPSKVNEAWVVVYKKASSFPVTWLTKGGRLDQALHQALAKVHFHEALAKVSSSLSIVPWKTVGVQASQGMLVLAIAGMLLFLKGWVSKRRAKKAE